MTIKTIKCWYFDARSNSVQRLLVDHNELLNNGKFENKDSAIDWFQ